MRKKVALITIGYELIGLEIFAAMLGKMGHEVRLFYDPGLFHDHYYLELPRLGKLFSQTNKTAKKVVDFQPDIVGITVYSETIHWASNMISLIKPKTDARIIIGGPHVTLAPKFCLDYSGADAVCVGEGWKAFPDFVENPDPGNYIENVFFQGETREDMSPQAPLIENLDALPYADKSLFEKDFVVKRNFSIMTGIGCPYNCNFCINNYYNKMNRKLGKTFRRRSVDDVMDELTIGKERYDFSFVSFLDDSFTIDKNWICDFLNKYRSNIGTPFYCLSHVGHLDPATIDSLKKSNCARLEIGVQSFHEPTRKELLGLSNSVESVIQVLKDCHKSDLPSSCDYIVGIPGADEQSHEHAITTFAKYRVQRVAIFWLHYFPNIDITQLAYEKGFISQETYFQVKSGTKVSYHTNQFITDKNSIKYINSVIFRCKLVPLVKGENSFWLCSKFMLTVYQHLPPIFSTFLDFVAALKHRNHQFKSYLSNYFLQFSKLALRKQ